MCGENNRNMTPIEIKNLAIKYAEGEVLTSMEIQYETIQDLSKIFLPLSLMTQEELEAMLNAKPLFLYELKENNIHPAKDNGSYLFNSFKYLTQAQGELFTEAVSDYYRQKANLISNN